MINLRLVTSKNSSWQKVYGRDKAQRASSVDIDVPIAEHGLDHALSEDPSKSSESRNVDP